VLPARVPVIMGVGGPLGARLLHAWSVLPVVSTSDRETAPGSNDEAMAGRFPEIVRGAPRQQHKQFISGGGGGSGGPDPPTEPPERAWARGATWSSRGRRRRLCPDPARETYFQGPGFNLGCSRSPWRTGFAIRLTPPSAPLISS
jgi:hypothetical protein